MPPKKHGPSDSELQDALEYGGYKTHKKNVDRLRKHVESRQGDWTEHAANAMNEETNIEREE
jgi:hypothetical protein